MAISASMACVALPWMVAAGALVWLWGWSGVAPAAALQACGGIGVARIAYERARLNPFYTWREGFRFSWSRAPRLLLVFAICGSALGIAWWGGAAIRLIWGWAPAAAGWVLGPVLLLLAAIAVAGGSALAVAVLWGPAIVATTDEEALEVLAQTLCVARRFGGVAGCLETVSLALFVAAVDLALLVGAFHFWVDSTMLPRALAAWRESGGAGLLDRGVAGSMLPLFGSGSALALLHAQLALHCAGALRYVQARGEIDGHDLLARSDRSEGRLSASLDPRIEVQHAAKPS